MDSDLECQHRVAKKFLSEEDKKEEKNFLPDSNFISLKKRADFLITRKKGVSLHGKYLILNIFLWNINWIMIDFISSYGLSKNISSITIICPLALFSYVSQKLLVFKK